MGSVFVETDQMCSLTEEIKAFLADPPASVAAPTIAALTASAAASGKVETKQESEESDEDTEFGLFD